MKITFQLFVHTMERLGIYHNIEIRVSMVSFGKKNIIQYMGNSSITTIRLKGSDILTKVSMIYGIDKLLEIMNLITEQE